MEFPWPGCTTVRVLHNCSNNNNLESIIPYIFGTPIILKMDFNRKQDDDIKRRRLERLKKTLLLSPLAVSSYLKITSDNTGHTSNELPSRKKSVTSKDSTVTSHQLPLPVRGIPYYAWSTVIMLHNICFILVS